MSPFRANVRLFLLLMSLVMLTGCISEPKEEEDCFESDIYSYPGGELGEIIEIELQFLALPGNVPNWVETKDEENVTANIGAAVSSLFPLSNSLWSIEPQNCKSFYVDRSRKECAESLVYRFIGRVYKQKQRHISDTDTLYINKLKYISAECIN